MQGHRRRVQPRVGPFQPPAQVLEFQHLAAAPIVISIIERVGRPDKLLVHSLAPPIYIAQQIHGALRTLGLRQRAGLVFQQRQQQPRADAVMLGHVIHELRRAAGATKSIFLVILQPARLPGHKSRRIEADLCRPIDEQAVGQDLIRRTP